MKRSLLFIRTAESGQLISLREHTHQKLEIFFCRCSRHLSISVRQGIARDQLVLVVSANHPWVDRKDITAADFPKSEWVIREVGSGTRAQLEAALEIHDLHLRDLVVALELPSNEAVRAAVESGSAATVISASVAAPGIEAGLLVHVPFALPERSFKVARHKERSLSRSAEAMLKLIKIS